MTTWTIRIFAPTGDFGATIEITGDHGVMTGKNGSGPMEDLKQVGNAISWSTHIEKPMPMKLSFTGEIAGDAITGKVRFGLFASGRFEGERVPQPV
ncbi:MAG: hypothetical protein AAGA15_05615 [Pseudomonadota bacterium]